MILNNLTPGGTCGAGRCSQVYTVNIYPKEDYSIRQNIYAVFQTRAIHLKLTTFYSSLVMPHLLPWSKVHFGDTKYFENLLYAFID